MVLGFASPARAQAVGEIVGLVTDVTGGVLSDAKVTATGSGLQQPRVTVTAPNGTYKFQEIPIGTYSVRFELAGFKQGTRERILITAGFTATVDMKLEVGSIDQRVEVTGAPPLVDPQRTTTGATIGVDVMNTVPTNRDIWQVINLTPAVVLGGVEFANKINVGGSAGAGAPEALAYGMNPFGPGTGGGASPNNIYSTWNIEGGNITNMVIPVPITYFNFASFQEIQVITGGGDSSVQSAGLFINIITKSGSNVLKASADITFENAFMQANNVTQAMFDANTSNAIGLTGSPIHRIDTFDGDIGGAVRKDRLWYWAGASNQDINLSIGNFFDTTQPGCNPPPSTFAQLSQVQACLANQRTLITNFNGKLNYQLNTANKFQLLVQTAQKTVNNEMAGPLVTVDATQTQHNAGGIAPFQNPTVQLTHTWLPTDRLVVVTKLTYFRDGLFSDFNDYTRCGATSYARDLAGNDPTDPTCLWNVQPLVNETTGITSRSPYFNPSESIQRSLELKTDGSYFVPHVLGGDHTFKFGVGWRSYPILSYSHQGGGAVAEVQCVNGTNCGDGVSFVAPGSPGGGLVPAGAILVRDGLINTDWHTYFGYLQDSFTAGRITATAGLRDDWQTSVSLGGCVRANAIEPTLLPAQCQGLEDPKQPFQNVAPRASVTYDLTGTATTALHASFAVYYASVSRLANALSDLGGVSLTYDTNQPNGACSRVAGASCWDDANHDGVVQANELIGTPSGPANFVNGVLTVVPPTIDPNLQLGRTREGIVGIDHQLSPNMHMTFDYTYRNYDHGLASYIVAPSGTVAGAIAQIVAASAEWQPHAFTDPNTGFSTTYYTLCSGCATLTGATFTTTSLQYTTYKGVTVTLSRRLANHWQGNVSYTWNDPRVFTPPGSFSTNGSSPGNPTGVQFTNGFTNGTIGYTLKAFASAALPYGFVAGLNLNIDEGAVRDEVINGPRTVPSGTGAISYRTLAFQDLGTSHLPSTRMLDVNVGKSFLLGRTKLTLSLNCFNVFNVSAPLLYTSDNASFNGANGSKTSFSSVASIVAPRIFRIDARLAF